MGDLVEYTLFVCLLLGGPADLFRVYVECAHGLVILICRDVMQCQVGHLECPSQGRMCRITPPASITNQLLIVGHDRSSSYNCMTSLSRF